MSFTPITVTGKYKWPDGTAATGQILFTLSAELQDPATNEMRAPHPIAAPLGSSGTISVVLSATDDTGIVPAGVTYTVTELIFGAAERSYSIAVPAASAGGTLDLADVSPVSAPTVGIPDGTVSLPGLRWALEQTTGLWRIAAGIIGWAILGVERLRVTAQGLGIGDGSSGSPSLYFTSDVDLGPWRIEANRAGWYGSFAFRGPSPWVDVTTYGAIPDGGVTDRTVEIQAAIDSISTTGGVIFFPPGNYRHKTLKYYANVIFQGVGIASQLTFRTDADFMFKNNDVTVAADHVVFRDLFLNGFSNQVNALGGINITKGQYCLLENVRIGGFKGSSVRFNGGNAGGDTMYGMVSGCSIDNIVAGGIGVELVSSASSQPDGTRLFNTTISASAGRTAFKITGTLSRGADSSSIVQCATIGCDTIIDSAGVTTRLIGNRFEVTSGNMTFTFAPSAGAIGPSVVAHGNTYAAAGGSVIWTDSAPLLSIKDVPTSFYPVTVAGGFTAIPNQSCVISIAALTQALTIVAPTLPFVGQRLTFFFVQDGTGGRTVTWNPVFVTSWTDTGNTAGRRSSIEFVYDGTSWLQIGAQRAWA